MYQIILPDEGIVLPVLFGYIEQHLFFKSQLGYLEREGLEGADQLLTDALVVDMQGKAEAFKKLYPCSTGDIFYPLIILVVEKDPVQYIEEVVFILQRRQELVPQPAEELLPEPPGQRNAAFHQCRRQVCPDQLRKDSMLKIVEQDRALMQGGRDRRQISRRVAPAAARTDGGKKRHEKIQSGLAIADGQDGAASGYGLDEIGLFFLFSSEHGHLLLVFKDGIARYIGWSRINSPATITCSTRSEPKAYGR